MRLRVAKKVAMARSRARIPSRRLALRRLYHYARHWGPPDSYHAVDWGDGLRLANCYQWAYWFEDVRNRQVARTQRGRRGVSTICLGLHHCPGWYESAVFTVDDDGWAHYDPCARYDTRAEAIAGHAALSARLAVTE